MQTQQNAPGIDEFLAAPPEVVQAIAPACAIFAAGGTRRAGALAGLKLSELATGLRDQMLACYQRIFQLGIQHLIAPIMTPKMFQETGLYGEKIVEWVGHGVAGPEARAYYTAHNWRVRLVMAEITPDLRLREPAEQLASLTREAAGPTLWMLITSSHERMWEWIAQAFARGARTRDEAVQALYGEVIPPATLCISFGKPFFSPDLYPPLLVGEMQSYWTQRPGYTIDDQTLRRILYDYAYVRQTWRRDKTGRAEEALAQRALWERGPTLGLGVKAGPFWYPAETSIPEL